MTCGVSKFYHYMTSDVGGIYRAKKPLDFSKKFKSPREKIVEKSRRPGQKRENPKGILWGWLGVGGDYISS